LSPLKLSVTILVTVSGVAWPDGDGTPNFPRSSRIYSGSGVACLAAGFLNGTGTCWLLLCWRRRHLTAVFKPLDSVKENGGKKEAE
jgi:hypothetical protein